MSTTGTPRPAPANRTAEDILAALRRHYGNEQHNVGPEWAALAEFSLAPGGGNRRCDLFLIRAWRGAPKRHERIAIEIKVSRQDLLYELRHPEKSAEFRDVSHRFYLAVPKDLIRPDDPIPDDWGVIAVNNAGGCRKIRDAKRNPDPADLPEGAVVEAFRRASRAETRIRSASADDPARIPDLERQLASSRQAEHRAKNTATELRLNLRRLLDAIASGDGWFCICGKPMTKPPRGTMHHYANTHADGSLECDQDALPAAALTYGYSRPTYDIVRLAEALELTDLGI